jgi:hypothetical protein
LVAKDAESLEDEHAYRAVKDLKGDGMAISAIVNEQGL